MKLNTVVTLVVSLAAIAISVYTLATRDPQPKPIGGENAQLFPVPPEDTAVPP